MPHTASLGGIEIPVTWSPEDAVGVMQEAGVVGAGGGGFPTYKKYEQAPRVLLVNAAESEPGYYADKLLLREEPEALVDVFDYLDACFSMDVAIIGAEEVAKPYMQELEQLARDKRKFSVGYFEPTYKFGEERALCRELLGWDIPASDLPIEHGIVVNNNETLWNVYNAVFRSKPVTTKFLHFYGEVEPLTVYEAPIGTLLEDLFAIHGSPIEDHAEHQAWDGGPILSEKVADPISDNPQAPVAWNTNAFLVTDPDKHPKNRYYPDPDYEHNTIAAPWAPDEIVDIEDEVDRVHVPRIPPVGAPAKLLVEEGDAIDAGDPVGRPAEGLSVGPHASIPGTVTEITEDHVAIER
jgi:Na+-translocating ferredoxin:NAD+ oxidoreductase RnfC subunit